MLLYCVRHGQSRYNAEGRIQGQSDAPLSELGYRQGTATAEALATLPIEAVYSSPLVRALETARPIAAALRLPVQSDPRLMELNAGIFENQLRTAMQVSYPEVMACWMRGDPDYAIPGGESRRDLMHRGAAVFRSIYAAGHRQAVVVAHGGLLVAAFKALLKAGPELHPFSLQNGSITRLELTAEAAILVTINQVDHLQGVGFGTGGDL
jgi:probable phosphoglycerate mutase